jgi:hypothetical protein
MNDMSAGIQSDICKKKHKPGALVMVSVETDGKQTKNPAVKFNGQVFRIEYKHQPKPTIRPQYTLVGCESEYGLPYWFAEEELILL